MRKLAIATAVSLGLGGVSSETIALDLGEIEIFSALNQNLDAEIGLLQVAPGELAGARARLADADAFTRAGLSMTPVLRELRFNVEQRPDGEPIVKVSSDSPVVEPFLNFLVELESSSVLPQTREYTLLLDPPAFVTQQQSLTATPGDDPETGDTLSVSTPVSLDEISEEDTGVELVLGPRSANIDDNAFEKSTVLDLSSIDVQIESELDLTTESDPSTLIFSEQEFANELGQPGATVQPIAGIDDGGSSIDLRREFLELPKPVIEDDSGSIEIELDGLVGGDPAAIVPAIDSEGVPLNEGSQSAVDVAVVENNERLSGLTVELDQVGSSAAELQPQVYLESITRVVVANPRSDDTPAAQSEEPALSTNLTGADPDIDAADTSLPPESETPLSQRAPVNEGPVTSFGDPDGEALDITGLVLDITDSVGGQNASESTVESTPADSVGVSLPTALGASTYVVASGDTLWSIARTQRPAGVSINQMLQVIVDANPDAFANGDGSAMRAGAVLTIPGGTGGGPAVATNAGSQSASESGSADTENRASDAAQSSPEETAPVNQDPSAESQLATNLDDVDKRMMLAQEELSAEAQQRDELNNRVDELEDSLSRMKELITLRESELSTLQNEISAEGGDRAASADSETASADTKAVSPPQTDAVSAETDTESAETDVISAETDTESTETDVASAETDSEPTETDVVGTEIVRDEAAGELAEQMRQLEDQINENATQAQERVDAQADADKNLASAQAEVESLRLASEEDALRQQLAQLRQEKEQLLQTAQADKLELVRQAEIEKAQLLESASQERERILAQLDEEKQRITDEADAERARIAAEAQAEKQRLASESEEMRSRLEALEAENSQLVAQAEIDKEQLAEATRKADEEQTRLLAEAEAEKKKFEEEATKVQDKLAALQKEANANLAGSAANQPINREPIEDADADGSAVADLAVPAVVGSGLAAAPLEREIGDRVKVLAAGGGVALLGLLGAWATRRRKSSAGEDRSDRLDDPSVDVGAAGKPAATHFDKRSHQHEDVENSRPTMGQAAVAAGAAAAATGAAVVTRDNVTDEQTAAPVPEQLPVEPSHDNESLPPMVEEVPADDTITEADVYLRYGLHGQAEDLLRGAIEKSPNVPEYQVKLMESFHDQSNTSDFKTAAQSFKERFGDVGPHWEHIAKMGRNLDSSDGMFSRVSTMGAATGGAVAVSDVSDAADVADAVEPDISLDDTIDASANFSVSDLDATGDLSSVTDAIPDDLDEISLDEVDMAALDDDGTLNLEELTGDQMSGLDLGTLDLTNPDGDSTLDNLTLDDANLNALGDLQSDHMTGMSPDVDLDEGVISRVDEMETMLDLAKAYIDMGDSDSAASALKDIVEHGSDAQKMEAQDLLSKLR